MKNKIENQNILVTGGAGFIGSYLTEALLNHNPKKIFVIDNLIRGSIDNLKNSINNSSLEFIEGDITDLNLLQRIVKESDFIFHLAALRINACADNLNYAYKSMVEAVFNLAETAVKYKVKKIIYSSSASVYGLAQHFPTPESDNPYDNRTFYGAAKLWGEQMLRSYKHMHGLDYLALRYFNVYGPRMDSHGKYTEVLIKWLECIKDNSSPVIHGDGSSSMDFIFVEDVAIANIKALMNDATDMSINIGSGIETTLKELLTRLLAISKSDLNPDHIGENTYNPVSRRYSDISLAKKKLGFIPGVTLEEGLKKTIDWYFSNKKNSSQ